MKITTEMVEAVIADTRYHYDGLLTIAVVECHNGFKAVGHSAATAEAHYSVEEGQKWARAAALKDIYVALAYQMKDGLAKVDAMRGLPPTFQWATPSEAM